MTRDEAKQLLPVIQAYADGKTIQLRYGEDKWEDAITHLEFSDGADRYRIKPDPPAPRYVPFTAADYIDHLHGRVIVHPVHGRQVIQWGGGHGVQICPKNTIVNYDYLTECAYEDTGKPVGREVTA